jgi:hypothetical protein
MAFLAICLFRKNHGLVVKGRGIGLTVVINFLVLKVSIQAHVLIEY